MRSKESSVLAVLLAITLVAGVLAASEVTQAAAPSPNFWASSAHDPDRVLGFDFAPDTLLTLTVDTGTGPIAVSDAPTTGPDGNFDYRDIPGFDLNPGDIVEVSDGATTKSLTLVGLSLDSLDYDADTASGTSDQPDGTPVEVSALEGFFLDTVTTTVTGGTWTANFAIDLTENMGGFAAIHDPDGDATVDAIEIEPPPNPQISVETPNQIWAHGEGWIAGRTVTITVDDDHDLSNGTLYSTVRVVEAWGPEPWDVGWNVDTGGFEIVPGHVVTIDDGVDTVRTLDVVDLLITEVNEAADTISGTAPPNAWVQGHANDAIGDAQRQVQAAADGTFTIDFGNPGVEGWEQGILDIRPGVGGAAQVFEDDGDSTHRSWRVAEPHIGVNVIHEELWAIDWPVGALLNFTVEDPGGGSYTDTMTVVDTSWGQTEAGYRFWGDFDVHAGQVITVTDGTLTKALTVSSLEVTNVDPDSETYTGTVAPDVEYDRTHEVCAWARHLTDDQQGTELCAIPDAATGAWTIDFTGVGRIVPGDHTGAYQVDADGDRTEYAWFVPPWIYVELGDDADFPDRINLDRWAFPVTVTNGTDTVEVSDSYGDGWESIEFDVTAGETITATGNDGKVKTLFLEELAVTAVTLWEEDPPSTVYGTTTASYQGQVQVTASSYSSGWWTERWTTTLAGSFEADFANPGNGWRERDIGEFGKGDKNDAGEVRANIWDADNDQVQAIWHSMNPRLIIVRGNDRIEAIDFPLGEPLTVELVDPNSPGIEFAGTGIVEANPDRPRETLLVFELGDYTVPDEATVTASDEAGTPLVTTQVIPFTVDEVDPDADTITGTAPEGSEVLVEADGGNWRYPIADTAGSWIADFSEPGDQPGEENPVDLGRGSSGGATLLAEGGSATTVLWRLPAASFGVDPTNDSMWGNEFAPDASVTITVEGVDRGSYPTDGYGQFQTGWDPADLDLVAGDLVEVTDGDTTKTHAVTALVATDVNDTDDTVSGMAAPGSDVDVWVHDSDAWRHVVADGVTGEWTADFSVAGAEPNEGSTADLTPGSNGNSGQCDEDDDCTLAGWEVPSEAVNEPPTGSATPTAQSVFYRETIDPFVVTVADVDSPQVDSTATWALVGEDPQPGLPPGLELLGTPCTGDAAVACTLTIEGETRIPAGDYSLEITLDDGQDSSLVAITITVIAEHDELNDIRADLKTLIDDDAFTWKGEFRARLARFYLGWAARSRCWDDTGHPDSIMAFLLLRAATDQLTKIRPGDTSQPEAVAELAERIVDLTRRSALYTIDQAVDRGGSQRHIDRAVAILERGDDKRAAGKLNQAISAYQHAWMYAAIALWAHQ